MAAQLAMPWYEASLMRTIFSLAFHACDRIGDTVSSNRQPQHAVQAQNVHLGEGQISLTFTSFKHHRGNIPETRILQASGGEACLVKLL